MKKYLQIVLASIAAVALVGCKPDNQSNVVPAVVPVSKVPVPGQLYRVLPKNTTDAHDAAAAMAMRDKTLYVVVTANVTVVSYRRQDNPGEAVTTRSTASFLSEFELQK